MDCGCVFMIGSWLMCWLIVGLNGWVMWVVCLFGWCFIRVCIRTLFFSVLFVEWILW